MSYRNDHDAAIARVDALTQELDHTEAERDRLKYERECLEAEVEDLRDRRPMRRRNRYVWTPIAIIAGVVGVLFSHDLFRHPSVAPPPPPPTPLTDLRVPNVAPPPSRSAPAATAPRSTAPVRRSPDPQTVDGVLACAARTQRETDAVATITDLRPLRASCQTAIEYVVRYGTISVEARELLTRWLALEDRLAPSLAAYNAYILRDPGETRYRAPAALREEFYATLRDRSAVLAALPDGLKSR